MKLLQLEILNLASLDKQGGEVINFVNGALGESTIFSIVGPTGSGKSTILDAICLALYCRAPRYPKKKGERKRKIEIYGEQDELEKNRPAPTDCCNILTRGKKDGYSKLTFQANNGNVYRAEWHIRFKSKAYDNPVTKLYKISTSADGSPQEEMADWADLPTIIGLDYEQFLRTVLIAQGSFANFLTAKEDERYELLEKLVGCEDLYTRIAAEIKSRRDDAVEAFNKVNASVDAVKQNLLADEEREHLEEEIRLLEKAENELADKKKNVEKLLQWYADDVKKLEDIQQKQASADKARQELEAFLPSILRLNLHDAITPAVDCLREVKRMETVMDNLKKNIEEYELKTKQQEGLIREANVNLDHLKENAVRMQEVIDETAPHIKKARELKTKVDAAKKVFNDREKAKNTADKELRDADKAVKDNAADTVNAEKAAQKAMEEQQATKADVEKKKEVLEAATTKAQELLTAEKQKVEGMNAEELQNQKNIADADWQVVNRALLVVDLLDKAKEEERQKKAHYAELEEKNSKLSDELAKLTIDMLTREVDTLQKTYTLMTSEEWGSHRALLEEGKPCPLCGATEHPYKENETRFDEAASELYDMLQSKKASLKSQQQDEKTWSGKVKKNEGEILGLKQRLQQLQEEIKKYEGEWQHLLQQNPKLIKDKDELEAVLPSYKEKKDGADAKLALFNKVQKEIERLTKQKDKVVRELTNYVEEAGDLLTKAQQKVNDANTKVAATKALAPNLHQQLENKQNAKQEAVTAWQQADDELKELKTAYQRELEGEEPDVVEQRLKKNKEDADDAVAKQSQHIAKMDTALGETKGALQSKIDQLDKEQQDCEKKNNDLREWLTQYNGREDKIQDVALEDVEAMYHATENWKAIREEKDRRTKIVVSTTALLRNAKDEHDKHQTEKPEKEQEVLQAELQELQESSHNDELVAAKARMANHVDAVRLLGDKVDELNQAEKMKNDWTTITDAIGGDGKTLRKIAQCYTLSFLIEHANVEIRKFNSRYELQQVKNSLGIRVIDHDRADDVRDTTSLSGGETFIVSLGLALGLSALSSRNISFENLFIDEGFGTLDPDTLSVVINSLAMLQSSQGKKVGVISHTDTMKENITTQIRIVKNGSSGSSHIEIYP